jgi:hypothetical protein
MKTCGNCSYKGLTMNGQPICPGNPKGDCILKVEGSTKKETK